MPRNTESPYMPICFEAIEPIFLPYKQGWVIDLNMWGGGQHFGKHFVLFKYWHHGPTKIKPPIQIYYYG